MRPTLLAGLAYNSSYRFTNCTLSCTGIGPNKLPKSAIGVRLRVLQDIEEAEVLVGWYLESKSPL